MFNWYKLQINFLLPTGWTIGKTEGVFWGLFHVDPTLDASYNFMNG